MKRVGTAGLVLLGLFILSNVAQAEIFKWVDANGKVHYSDRKTSTQAQTVNVKTGSATLGQQEQVIEDRLMQQQKYVNFLQSERVERQEKRQEAQQEKDKQLKLCATMQDQLRGYTETNYRWYEYDEKTGEKYFLSDSQVDSKKKLLEAEIKKSNCS